MSRSEKEGSSIQPDGSLLSLVGDLLFAGAILVMIYPCLRKTVSRLDRQFFSQTYHILQIVLAVAALCFILMLLIGQQMRVAYCSFIRPYVGDSEEEKAKIGVLLKILVCLLLMVNYFCASGLEKLVRYLSRRLQPEALAVPEMAQNAASLRARYCAATFGDALTNNSNTNSQTPVTQTQSVMQSDILPSMSFPELNSDTYQYPAPTTDRHQRMYRNVGTMVRFPASDFQHNSHCTLHFCATPSHCPTTTATTTPGNTFLTSLPSTTTSGRPHSTPVASRRGRVQKNASPGDRYSPNHQQRPGSRQARVQSSCHVHLESFGKPNQKGSSFPRAQTSFQCSAGKVQSNCTGDLNYQSDDVSVESDPSSILSSNATGTDSSSGVSNQSSFLSHLGLTSVLDSSQSPRVVLGVQSRVQGGLQFTGPQTQYPNGLRQSSNAQTQVWNVPPEINTAHTQSQTAPPSVWIQNDGYDPVIVQSSYRVAHGPAITQSHHPQGPCNFLSGNLNGTVASHPLCSSLADACVVPTRRSSHHSHVVTGECSHHSRVAIGQCSHHSHITCGQCSCHTSLSLTPLPLPTIQKTTPTRVVKRRWQLPPMPKMTRSGKIYGYG